MGRADVAMREFWGKEEHFADLFNAALFHGRQVLRPEELATEDSILSVNVTAKNGKKTKRYMETLQYATDVIKKQFHGVEFVLFTIQNQMKVDYSMPVREMLNQAVIYMRECRMLAGQNEASGERLTYEERFSVRKEDRIHGVIGLTVYYGEKPWDGPRSLHEMLADMPEEMRMLVSDFSLNLVEIVDSDRLKFRNPKVEQVFTLSRNIYQKKIDRETFASVHSDVAEMVGAIVNSEQIIKMAKRNEGGEINMCNALEEMMSEREEKGKEIGKEIGQQQGEYRSLVRQIICKIKKGRDPEQTAEMLEAEPGLVKHVYDLAWELAPEYDEEKIVGKLMEEAFLSGK